MLKKILSICSIYLSLTGFNITYFSEKSLAQSCNPLPLVGGEGSQVNKVVSQPTIGGPLGINITGNNWNTDWVVPSKNNFQRFVAVVSSDQNVTIELKMYLKYNDQTADEFFNNTQNITPENPLKVEVKPRKGDQPYQVNLFVGGIQQIGKTYSATVSGCI